MSGSTSKAERRAFRQELGKTAADMVSAHGDHIAGLGVLVNDQGARLATAENKLIAIETCTKQEFAGIAAAVIAFEKDASAFRRQTFRQRLRWLLLGR